MRRKRADAATARQPLRVDFHGAVAALSLRHPDPANPLHEFLVAALSAKLAELDANGEVRAVVLDGGAGGFAASAWPGDCARAVARSRKPPGSLAPGSGEFLRSLRQEALARVGRLGVPLVAAVRGRADGEGCELALACDLIVAAEDAEFRLPAVSLGVLPGSGATQRLPRAAGKARAMELVLTGRPLRAPEALAWGLVNRVVPAAKVLAEALALAQAVAAQPPLAARAAKEALLHAFEAPLSAGLRHERALFCALVGTADAREAVLALAERRPPRFRGR